MLIQYLKRQQNHSDDKLFEIRSGYTFHIFRKSVVVVKMSPMEIFLDDDKLKSTIRKTWNFEYETL